MPYVLRVALLILVVMLPLVGLLLHVHRRTARALALPAWGSRLLLVVLGSGIVCMVASRVLLQGELGRVAGAVGSLMLLGILLSSVLLWPYELFRALRALVGWLARRRRQGASLAPSSQAEANTHAVARSDGAVPEGCAALPGPAAQSLALPGPHPAPELAQASVLVAAPQPSSPARPAPPARPSRMDAPAQPERRAFLERAVVGGAVSLGFGTSSYGALFGRHDYQIETVPLVLEKLPRALDGFTVVQLSDIHVGLFVGEAELRAGLELVRKAKPDIVVLTGDLVDHDVRYVPLLARFARKLRELAPHGVFAIPGNHDHYTGVAEVIGALRKAGTEVLVNRHVRVGDSASFVLAGVDDPHARDLGGRGPDITAAMRGASPDLARVLLAHNPALYPELHASADLVLSGHTHGGQITLFINPAELVLRHGYVRGHYQRDSSQLYVNRGFGTAGPPARVGSPPEVSRLILTSST